MSEGNGRVVCMKPTTASCGPHRPAGSTSRALTGTGRASTTTIGLRWLDIRPGRVLTEATPEHRAVLLDALPPLQSQVVQLRLGLPLDDQCHGHRATSAGHRDGHGGGSGDRSLSGRCNELGGGSDSDRARASRSGMTLGQVAELLHLTRVQVRHCEVAAFRSLREMLAPLNGPCP